MDPDPDLVPLNDSFEEHSDTLDSHSCNTPVRVFTSADRLSRSALVFCTRLIPFRTNSRFDCNTMLMLLSDNVFII